MISFEKIASRFNKHKSISGKYIIPRGSIVESGEIVIQFPEENGHLTFITTGAIEGVFGSTRYSENVSDLKDYSLIDSAGNTIDSKDNIRSASGVLINGRSRFFLPNDAILPLCNLLNLFENSHRKE